LTQMVYSYLVILTKMFLLLLDSACVHLDLASILSFSTIERS